MGELRLSESDGPPPPPGQCKDATDVGRIHHDEIADIWYECAFDDRRRVYTWVILPPGDE